MIALSHRHHVYAFSALPVNRQAEGFFTFNGYEILKTLSDGTE